MAKTITITLRQYLKGGVPLEITLTNAHDIATAGLWDPDQHVLIERLDVADVYVTAQMHTPSIMLSYSTGLGIVGPYPHDYVAIPLTASNDINLRLQLHGPTIQFGVYNPYFAVVDGYCIYDSQPDYSGVFLKGSV